MELRIKKLTELLHKSNWLGVVDTYESAFQGKEMQGHISRVKTVGHDNNPGIIKDNHLNMNFS